MNIIYNTIDEVKTSEKLTENEKNAIASYCEYAERIQVTIEYGFVQVRKFLMVNEVFGIEYARYEISEVDTESEISVFTALFRSRESKFI